MSRVTHEQAYADREYLWHTFGPARDMTGAYGDQEDLEALLRSPTKATATRCLCNQIEYWFQVGPEDGYVSIDRDDPMLLEIMLRHDMDLWF